ncbi:hypothetical protein M422DRAFT_26303 [Sphaerobolus stellatus SS14]|nr:hypothetical protein M422DRAFT_26303 [Sphaerobolus stellatus SS14]
MEDGPAVMMQHEDHAVEATPITEDNAVDAIAADATDKPTESTEKKPAALSGKKERKSDSGGLIRRFSTLLRGGKKDDHAKKESAVPETPAVKEEAAVAEVPIVDVPTEAEALTAETPAPAAPTPDVPIPTPAASATPSKAKKDKKAIAKPTEQEKTAQRRSSLFLNLSQRNKKTRKALKEVKKKLKEMSITVAIKEITELTDGRVDLVNAAITTTARTIKASELKGTELRMSNFIGPIAFTNALLPFHKAEPEVKKVKELLPVAAEAAPTRSTEKMEEAKEHMKSESMAMKMEETATTVPTTNIDPVSPAANTAPATTANPPAATTEEPTSSFPSTPFPIANVGGQVYFAVPARQTLFSISRATVQVAVAKYAGDDVSGAVKNILEVLPRLTTRDNGKLVKAAAV